MHKFFVVSLFVSLSLKAATVAIIDSGVDYTHDYLAPNIWVNPAEIPDNNRDEDRNGYQDDIYGWNFAENNNQVIDFSYLGSFSTVPYTYFDIQLKAFLGKATPVEMEWMKNIREDKEAIKELGIFGNFVHGSHVAGIAVGDTNHSLISVKLLPTEVKLPGGNSARQEVQIPYAQDEDFRLKLIKTALGTAGVQQMKMLQEVAYYVGQHGSDVANGSFGTGVRQAQVIIMTLYKALYGSDAQPSKEVLMELIQHFFGVLISEAKEMIDLAPETLFVFAAGNDGLNNDIYPISPANVRGDNTITVAATYERLELATFSNYGVEHVDVAAPGLGINSSIPGNEFLKVSGTSQAAPYVARISGLIKDANPSLSPLEIKKILMGTVDLKDFLVEKVKSGGVVNELRAVKAAEMTQAMGVDQAVNLSRSIVGDIDVPFSLGRFNGLSVLDAPILPMPSQFFLK